MSGVVIALETQTLRRWRAAVSSAETYSSNALIETRQIPLLPIFTAANCPDRMSVYTCEIETRSTSATSSGVMNLCVSLICHLSKSHSEQLQSGALPEAMDG